LRPSASLTGMGSYSKTAHPHPLLPLREIRDVENPPSDQFVKPVSGLGDAGKQLGLGVRPRRSRVEMMPSIGGMSSRLTRAGGFRTSPFRTASADTGRRPKAGLE
jgi:hypothetical protein